MGYKSVMKIFKPLEKLIHDVFGFGLAQLRVRMTDNVREEISASAELEENVTICGDYYCWASAGCKA